MLRDEVMKIINQPKPSKEDLDWLRKYRDRKVRFLELQGLGLNEYIIVEIVDLIGLINIKLLLHSPEKMN